MISRRNLLFSSLAGIAGLAALRLGLSSPETAIRTVLRKRLSYLKLDEAGIKAFATDFIATGNIARSKLRLIAAMAPLYRWLPEDGSTPDAIQHGEERIVTAYLLSSDFFITGADENEPVHYTGFFDPWGRGKACQNPFARTAVEVS